MTSESASEKKSDRDESFSENTVQEDKIILVNKDGFEDFDDINEGADEKAKIEVNTNKAGPISFDAKRNENMAQKKNDFKKYMEKMKKG